MTETWFQNRVTRLAEKSGIPSDLVHFEREDGKYIARIDGILIMGNSISSKVTVCFGSGHKAMAAI